MRKSCWFLLTLFLIGSLLGCGTIDYSKRYPIYKEMESWVNHPISEVIASWGEPTQIVPSDEGSVYAWREILPYAPWGYTVFNEKKFWVNESGIIFRWDILGPGTLTF
jgi:hypothetical protein